MSPPQAAPPQLGPITRPALLAVARRIAPAAFATRETVAAFEHALDARIAGLEPRARRRLQSALLAFDHPLTGLLTGRSFRRFGELEPDTQDAVLSAWERSATATQRMIFQAMRRLVLAAWYSVPAAQSAIGYLGPYHERGPRFAWEGPLPGDTRSDEPVRRGQTTATQLDLPLAPTPGLASGAPRDRGMTADVCIIGSGAGGGVMAARLAEAGLDVVLLEEGGYYAPAELDEHEASMTARLYAEGGARTTEDLGLGLLQGRTLGGGTTINWMLMLEPPEYVLHEWERDYGASLLASAAMRPELARIGAEVHATFVPDDAHDPANRIILDGGRRLGWKAERARINALGCIRTGLCGLGCRYHAKQSTLAVYVPRALRAGARILSDVRADRIERVERVGPRPLKRVHATILTRETRTPIGSLTVDAPIVVLAAGAIATPLLLERSGLHGDAVGQWLRLHPTTAVAGLYDDIVYQAAGIPQSAVCTEFHEIDDGYGTWVECPPYLPALAAVATPGFGAAHAARMARFARTAALIVLTRDGHDRTTPNGRVRLRRDGAACIEYAPLGHEWQLLRLGMRAAALLHFAAGAREVHTIHNELPPLRSPEDLNAIDTATMQVNRIGLFSAHVNGTCRMAADRRSSGCSPDAERWGVPGLYIADGSILPTAPGVNPQWTIMAAASLIAVRILERHPL